MRKFHEKVAEREYLCKITEWDCPHFLTWRDFKKNYLEPLKRAADQFMSAATYWKELDAITLEEFYDIQAIWLKVEQYLKKQ